MRSERPLTTSSEKAGVDQLVVLIDDLDRCLPDTAIDTLEAVRLFVFTSRTAFVVATDEAMIEYSAVTIRQARRRCPTRRSGVGRALIARCLQGDTSAYLPRPPPHP